jgi:hypothetical protein
VRPAGRAPATPDLARGLPHDDRAQRVDVDPRARVKGRRQAEPQGVGIARRADHEGHGKHARPRRSHPPSQRPRQPDDANRGISPRGRARHSALAEPFG